MLKNSFLIIILVVLIVIGFSSGYIVNQTETAIVLEFKKPVGKPITAPGLQWKAPWQNVIYFDKRILDFSAPAKTVISGDMKRLEVDAYVKYRINNPLKFLQTVKTDLNLAGNLDPILESSMRKVISEEPLSALLSNKRDDIMNEIKTLVNDKAANYGVEVVDVRIVRADFPQKNRSDIYARMRSEREREAKDLRAKGAEEATKIQAQADRQRTEIISTARADAERIKGEGDGEASQIYASSYGKDPEFFKFYRSMEAYRNSINKADTSFVLSPNSEFLKYFKDSK